MISAGELAALRAARTETANASVVIKRNTAGTWATVATERCSFAQAPILPQENSSESQRLFIDDRWRFVFAAGADVRFQDRIVVGARTFEVLQVPTPSRELSRLAIAQELNA